jgi:hypothetical protein
MTTAEFMALSPRERDAVVAEHIFGYRREMSPKDANGDFGGLPMLVPPDVEHGRWAYPPIGDLQYYWVGRVEWMKTWAGMKLVIDAMRERGWSVMIRYKDYGLRANLWYAEFFRNTEEDSWSETHVNPPLAASIAALRAVGEVTD